MKFQCICFRRPYRSQLPTILVQIASYREADLVRTPRDSIAKAAHPENLRFGICWPHDESADLGEFLSDSRFRVIDARYRNSKGVFWARNVIITVSFRDGAPL